MSFTGAIRRIGLRILTLPGIRKPYRALLGGSAIIFMLHRFSDPRHEVVGTEPEHLRWCLGWLRDNEYHILSLDDLVHRVLEGEELPPGTVSFTVDDGYYDFFHVGLEVFTEFDCPVTVFLPTGFLDGQCWLWWDQVEYLVGRTERSRLEPVLPGLSTLHLTDDDDRKLAVRELVGLLRTVPDSERVRGLKALSEQTGVELPRRPPPAWRPMTWDEVSAAEEQGARFAPHSRTHPILSRTTPERCAREISDSWSRVCREVDHPVPVFGYPDGAEFTFGDREEGMVRREGLLAAVSTRWDYVSASLRTTSPLRWRLPRFGLPDNRLDFLQIASGLLRCRQKIRGVAPH